MLKNTAKFERDTLWEKFTAISLQVSSASLSGISAGHCQRVLVDDSGIIRNQTRNAQ
jgi:hypothetical protein